MSLRVVDDPPDRPAWLRETLRLMSEWLGRDRAALLDRVAAASDADLAAGTEDDWGIGQIAVHLLVVERGVLGIGLRLARGEAPGPTGQPRPAVGSATRDGIAALARKAGDTLARAVADFPADPNTIATARHPYYGEMNCFGWLLTLPNHYAAHVGALERGTKSAL